MSEKEKRLCRICGKEYTGEGYNAWPLSKGRCCYECYTGLLLRAIRTEQSDAVFDCVAWQGFMSRAWVLMNEGVPIMDAIYRSLPIQGYEKRAGEPLVLELESDTKYKGITLNRLLGRLVKWAELRFIAALRGGLDSQLAFCGIHRTKQEKAYDVYRLDDQDGESIFYFIERY